MSPIPLKVPAKCFYRKLSLPHLVAWHPALMPDDMRRFFAFRAHFRQPLLCLEITARHSSATRHFGLLHGRDSRIRRIWRLFGGHKRLRWDVIGPDVAGYHRRRRGSLRLLIEHRLHRIDRRLLGDLMRRMISLLEAALLEGHGY